MSYADVMDMNLLAVVTTPSIYHGCYTQKNFWEENFTLGEFTPTNMKNCGRRNFRKHREIENGEKYTTLDISLEFGCLDKMKIKYSETKGYLVISGKGLITSQGLKNIGRSNKNKKERYFMTNVSMKYV